MIFTIVKDGKELYLPNGVFSKKGYVLVDEATPKQLKRTLWVGALLWLITMLAVAFIDNGTAPFLWVGVTVVFYFLMVNAIRRITRDCEVMSIEESKSELYLQGFEKVKTTELVVGVLALTVLITYQIVSILRGIEDPAYEYTMLAIFILLSIALAYVLAKRIGKV